MLSNNLNVRALPPMQGSAVDSFLLPYHELYVIFELALLNWMLTLILLRCGCGPDSIKAKRYSTLCVCDTTPKEHIKATTSALKKYVEGQATVDLA